MKITFVSTGTVIDCFPPKGGGIEVLEFELIKALKRRGHESQLFASHSSISNSVNIGFNWIRNERLHTLTSMLNCHTKKSLVKGQIIHCHYALTAVPFLGLRPLVYTEHNWYNLPGMDFHRTFFTHLFDSAQKKVYDKADRIIALSSEIKKIIQSKVREKEKVEFIPNFVNTKIFAPKKKIPNRILFAGRLAKEKGLDLLLNALKAEKDYELIIAGEGPERKALEQLASRNKIKAKFLGFVPHKELPALFSSASIFVLPSYFEVMPVVILEAMASGCAVIASDAFGIRDQIDNEKNGLIFRKGNARQLKQKIKALLKDEGKARELGRNARHKALKEFDAQIIAGKIESLYREVLEARK
ncbi:MAG: glycosyltransferase family 4 protein [Candidatus Diapherotrites archaeon]